MDTVSSSDFDRRLRHYKHVAVTEPVLVRLDGPNDLVLLSAAEFQRLKRRDREVLTLADFTEADLQAIREATPPAESAAFDHEVTD